ncbi:phenylalanine--tRNA ligase subunit beta [Parvibium lacunae]|uniref:Phenylalanine--tRNA ligase beta subunit n=1 Tax=Parvibium lacunae TaxID=1888893 RepID=A0A368L7I1_9BURK|nr:phenylalanine--tRNA ligase subunit beta [Parvibium lacunae]RCS59512.1 phenylalanine--tRNA ligase subunit beta [Parvibium lacunae]
MKFSENWLRTFVNPALDNAQLTHLLTMAGLEVEENDPVAPAFTGVVVAEVLEVAPHPNADRLRVCKVNVGQAEPLQIVCGAPNVAVGLKVPCATIGASLPGGMAIKPVTMRGVDSQGMLCSAKELGISEESNGLHILVASATAGQDIRQALDLDDRLITIKLTPNKADCLSLLGVAREVSALTDTPLSAPANTPVPSNMAEVLPVKIEAPDLCGRFTGRVLRGVNAAAPTPQWMKDRLERCGQRSISALVDISNYVMLEQGRPNHIFDLDKVSGGLTVRWAKAGETLKLLNEQTIELAADIGVVADANGPEAMAGIMGGDATAVSTETRNIYLEAAFWWPEAIAGKARRYNFSTDASHRFERGVDFATNAEHIERLTQLILEVCGGVNGEPVQVGPIDDQAVNLPARTPVKMRVARAQKIIGVAIPESEMAAIFKRLQLSFTLEDGMFTVTPPSYRFDIAIEEDLVEEIARVYGFDNIPANPPVAPSKMLRQPEGQRTLSQLRQLVAQADYQEVINYSFVEAEWETDFAANNNPIKLLNPIASQLAVMRSNLVGSLLQTLRFNLNRKASRVRVFEIGRVFKRDAVVVDGPATVAGLDQPLHVGGLAFGPAQEEQWGTPTRAVDFYDVKADLELLFAPAAVRCIAFSPDEAHPALHPGRSANIEVNGRVVGWLGELHPRWQQKYDLPQQAAPVLFEIEAEALRQIAVPVFAEISRFPAVVRDLAVVVPIETPVQVLLDVVATARSESSALGVLQDVRLFDEFRSKDPAKGLMQNEKSLAFRLTLQDTEQTLDDAVVDAAITQVTQLWTQHCDARLR